MNSPFENPPQLYALTREDFEKPPTDIEDWSEGDKITRENFLSFLINSFEISRGNYAVQILLFQWLELNFGFNYQDSFHEFSQAGRFDVFTSKEKEMFREYFNSVRIHAHRRGTIINEMEVTDDAKTDEMIKFGITQICSFSQHPDAVLGPRVQKRFSIEKINSLGKFDDLAEKEKILKMKARTRQRQEE